MWRGVPQVFHVNITAWHPSLNSTGAGDQPRRDPLTSTASQCCSLWAMTQSSLLYPKPGKLQHVSGGLWKTYWHIRSMRRRLLLGCLFDPLGQWRPPCRALGVGDSATRRRWRRAKVRVRVRVRVRVKEGVGGMGASRGLSTPSLPA